MFVAILGHDLRNPLGAMVTGAELLACQLTDDKHLRTLQRMMAAGHRMTAMIEQLLDLTRARLGGGIGFVRVRTQLDVRELVQRSIDELCASHPGRDIRFESARDCTTSGDPERLLQLFSNLVANALTHSRGQGGVWVSIASGVRDVTVEIRNSGVIPPERVPTLFEPFQRRTEQAQADPTSRSSGLGLGLFISQQIATAHGGGITVASDPAAGTVVTVRLPRSEQRNAERTGWTAPEMPAAAPIVANDDDHQLHGSARRCGGGAAR
jgi:signal transduction histidine kinase